MDEYAVGEIAKLQSVKNVFLKNILCSFHSQHISTSNYQINFIKPFDKLHANGIFFNGSIKSRKYKGVSLGRKC